MKTGGKQYRVEQGQTLLVERLPLDAGATLMLEPLMVRSDAIHTGGKALADARVEAKILSHERGPKLRVFKFKPKRGYKRRTGHRQDLTRIEVTQIALKPGGAAKAPAAAAGAAAATPAPVAAPSARPAAAPKAATGTAKPAPKPAAKPAAKSATKPAAKATAKPAAKPAPKRKPKKEGDDGA